MEILLKVIMASRSWFEHYSKSLVQPLETPIWSLFVTLKLDQNFSRQAVVALNIVENQSSSLQEVVYGHYLPQFTNKKLTKS